MAVLNENQEIDFSVSQKITAMVGEDGIIQVEPGRP